MLKFKEFIKESSFSLSDLKRVSYLLQKVLAKETGFKFYPFGYNNIIRYKRAGGQSGQGYMYTLDDGRMVRFNWDNDSKSSTISSIDIWDSIDTINSPRATLFISPDINILDVVKRIARFIKQPKLGIFEEVRRAKHVLDLADKHGYSELVRSDNPEDKAKWKTIYKKLQRLEAKKGQKETNTVTKEINDAETAVKNAKINPEELFEDLDALIDMVANGVQPSLLITGMAGIGKTYSVTKRLQTTLGAEGIKWAMVKGKTSPFGLYSQLFMHRDKLIVFDDIDSVFQNMDTKNMLKAALDSYEKREISWISKITIPTGKMSKPDIDELFANIEDDLEKGKTDVQLPDKFTFTGRVIFISNLPSSKIDSAIKSRSYDINIELDRKGVISRMRSILPYLGDEASLDVKEEVLQFLEEQDMKRELSIRTFILALRARLGGNPNWKRLLRYT